MTDFLAENNACGQHLLSIVSTGNSIIAELLRLKDYIPDIFRLDNKNHQQYQQIILDFTYFEIAENHEKKIECNQTLQDLDNEIRENYEELITRFYLAFESIHQYASELRHYIDKLNEGYYIQHTLETVLQDSEGKQLLCESLYLFGTILLILDLYIPGDERERLIVAYYRYSAAKSHSYSNIDDVCMLLRSTGYISMNYCSSSGKIIKSNDIGDYPVAYFSRFTFDATFIDLIIGKLRSDDIYNQLDIYTHPDQRATALSTQAGMLFVCLFFKPDVLHCQAVQMREIVDKFFLNNWMVSIYMGTTINLIDAWDQFKAAKNTLAPIIECAALKDSCLLLKEQLSKVRHQIKELLRDGILTEAFVLQSINKISQIIRQGNVLLRWYLMHTSKAIMRFTPATAKKVQQVQDLVENETQFRRIELFELLLNCSEMELFIKEILRKFLRERNKRWNDFKSAAFERLNELSDAFSEIRSLAKIQNQKQLKKWFTDVAKEISKLCIESPKVCGNTIVQLIQALEEVQDFHNLQSNMQVKQYLMEARDYLQKMMQVVNMKEDILITIQLISDLSYAWRIIRYDYTEIMQENIKKIPKSVIKLRAVFLKLASALEIPLLRINQAKSEDLESVSKYYSTELANYIRRVMQIIPKTIFSILARIIHLETEVLKEFPTHVEKEKIKEYAQFEDRFTVSKLTCSIAVFTDGILMMEKTLVGVIELDPKQLLEDGIRKELVRNLANALNVGLIFQRANKSKSSTSNDLESKLLSLTKTIDGYRRSFEYIQDYLHVHGLKILHEELTRIINYNVEKEYNAYNNHKLQDWQSKYQNDTIPIPNFPMLQGDLTNSNNFIGRLVREILHYTDPKNTVYAELKAAWYEKLSVSKEVLNGRFFSQVRKAIGPVGLVGIDRLYSSMLTNDLKLNLGKIQKSISNDKMWTDALNDLEIELENKIFPENLAESPSKFYTNFHTCWLKVWPTIADWILQTGQIQIIRQQIAYELDRSSKIHSKDLKSSLQAFNSALLTDFQMCAINPEQYSKPSNELISNLNDYLIYVGEYDPLEQIFIATKNSHHIALFFFLFTIAHLSKLKYAIDSNTPFLPKTSKDLFDGTTLITGILTILQQFHIDMKMLYLTYLCQYVAALAEWNLR